MRLQILRKFVVHKPHTRKTCLTEPLRRIIEPLRRNTEPHCGIIEPLRRNVKHHCEIMEPIQRNIWPHCGTIEPLRRKIEHFSSKAKKTCANVESLCGINKSFSVNQICNALHYKEKVLVKLAVKILHVNLLVIEKVSM